MVLIQHRRLGGLGQRPQQKAQHWTQQIIPILLVIAAAGLIAGAAVSAFRSGGWGLSDAVSGASSVEIKGGARAKGVPIAKAEAGAAPAPRFREPSPEELAKLRAAARVLDPEVIQHTPEQFDNATKNPCFTDKDGQFRCLPYFYVTGMFHAGAFSLAEKLGKHPDVVTDACTNCQFWGEEGKPMGFYLEHMKHASEMIKAAPQTKVLMDNSPSTFAFYWAAGGKAHRGFQSFMQGCYKQCVDTEAQTKVTVQDCMSANCYNQSLAKDVERAVQAGIDYDLDSHNPLLVRAVYGSRPPKMVVVVRDPVARLFSAFHGYPHYHGKYGKNTRGFTAYVKEQVGAFRECAKDHGERRCAILFEALGIREERVYFHCDQLFRGMYGLWLETWYRFVPPQHWLVLHSDDLFTPGRQRDTLRAVAKHLGLRDPTEQELDAMVAAGQPKSYSTGQEAIEPEARQLLLDLYRPSNTLLAQLTGDSRFEDWNKGEVAAVEAAGAGTAGGGAAGAAPQQAAVGGGGAPQAAGR